jgi:hypothetical protein
MPQNHLFLTQGCSKLIQVALFLPFRQPQEAGERTMVAPTQEKIAASETEIMALANAGQREEARDMLIELTVACAQGGDLNNAQRLRDLLYKVDPMALTEIIKVNELIEEAMNSSVNENFNLAWDSLRQIFTQEEFLGLYHSLEMHEVGQGKVVAQIGSRLDAIIFVNEGNLNVVCRAGDKNIACKVLEPGSMFGENCFQPSLWTAALVTRSPANLGVLRERRLTELEGRIPGIESKLSSYYEKLNDLPTILAEQEVDRRRYARFRADSMVTFQILGKDGKTAERSYKGEVHNIARGGLAFLLRIAKRESRRMLFGRRVLVTVPPENGDLKFTGTVVAVTLHDPREHDYSVHLAFDQPVSEELIRPLILPDPEPLEEHRHEGEEPEQSTNSDVPAEDGESN